MTGVQTCALPISYLFCFPVTIKSAIETTTRRRQLQEAFNKEHGITPTSTIRKMDENLKLEESADIYNTFENKKDKIPPSEKKKIIAELTKAMHEAAKILEFEKAAKLRDQIEKLKKA